MPLSVAARDLMLDELADAALYVSLHSADPGAGGGNELTGGSPTYARQSAVWGPASGGVLTLAADATFDVPAGASVAYFGIWSAASGGTFYGSGSLPVETFTGQGQYVLRAGTSITLT